MSSVNLIEHLKQKFPDIVTDSHDRCGDQTVIIAKEGLLTLMKYLRFDPVMDFNMLMDLTAVDCLKLGTPHRFEAVYHLYSLKYNHRLRVKAPVTDKDCEVESIVSFWPAADWFEREAFDMFGVRFKNHPNLKRILMYEEFEGHPLRKDYPYNKRQPLIGPEN